MKKMIVLTSLWSFLFIFSFSMFGCSEDDDEFGTTAERGNEVRTPRVEEINGKAVSPGLILILRISRRCR